MKKTALLVVFSICVLTGSSAFSKVHCADDSVVAKQGVEYSLLGAWMPFADHSCFIGKKRLKYFRPELAEAEGEVTDWSAFTWFDPSRDSYKILGTKRVGALTHVNVRFTVNGKSFETTYIYEPDADYAMRVGICGYITNPTHNIVRIDCANAELIRGHLPPSH